MSIWSNFVANTAKPAAITAVSSSIQAVSMQGVDITTALRSLTLGIFLYGRSSQDADSVDEYKLSFKSALKAVTMGFVMSGIFAGVSQLSIMLDNVAPFDTMQDEARANLVKASAAPVVAYLARKFANFAIDLLLPGPQLQLNIDLAQLPKFRSGITIYTFPEKPQVPQALLGSLSKVNRVEPEQVNGLLLRNAQLSSVEKTGSAIAI